MIVNTVQSVALQIIVLVNTEHGPAERPGWFSPLQYAPPTVCLSFTIVPVPLRNWERNR